MRNLRRFLTVTSHSSENERICLTTNSIAESELIELIATISHTIKHANFLDQSASNILHCERGTLFLKLREYERAIDDFSYVLLNPSESPSLNEDLIGKALWGRMWSYAILGLREEFSEDLMSLAAFIELNTNCDCLTNLTRNLILNPQNQYYQYEESDLSADARKLGPLGPR